MTSSIFGNAVIKVAEVLPRISPTMFGRKAIRCCCKEEGEKKNRGFYRRQVLLASTSLRVRGGGFILKGEEILGPPADLTNYRKLSNAMDAKSNGSIYHEQNIGIPGLEYSHDFQQPPKRNANDLGGVVAHPPAALAHHQEHANHDSPAVIREVPVKRRRKNIEEVMLAMDGIEVRRDRAFCFHVYVHLPAKSRPLTSSAAYAGSFVHMPPTKQRHVKGPAKLEGVQRCCLRLGISDILDELHADADADAKKEESIVVRLVPTLKSGDAPDAGRIKVASIKVEYK